MTIWVDADACPRAVKEIIFRAARRLEMRTVLVANKPMYVPESSLFSLQVVPQGPDVADEFIVEGCGPGDLIITEDIPLADAVIAKEAVVLTPHGRLLDDSNIGEALSMRNFMDEVRSGGIQTGGPAAFSNRDKETFARALQQLLG